MQFEYDALNNMVEETWHSGTTLVRTLSFAFDAAGQLLSASDPAAGGRKGVRGEWHQIKA